MTSITTYQQEKNEVIQTPPTLTPQPSTLPNDSQPPNLPIPCPHELYNTKQNPTNPSTLPISEVNMSTYLTCHWCLRSNWTRVMIERGWSTYMCTYLACQFTCVPCIGWYWTKVMDQRHYCGTCDKLLIMRQGAPGLRKDKGLKVYTKLGSVRVKPGEELPVEHWNEREAAEKVLFSTQVKRALEVKPVEGA